jgi:hypothetical protein
MTNCLLWWADCHQQARISLRSTAPTEHCVPLCPRLRNTVIGIPSERYKIAFPDPGAMTRRREVKAMTTLVAVAGDVSQDMVER